MKKVILLALVLAAAGYCQPAVSERALTAEPWLFLSGHWTQAPRESGVGSWITTRIMRFKPDHSFSMTYCTIHKVSTRRSLSILSGEGWTILSGRWSHRGRGKLEVTYSTLEEDFPAVGATDPGEVTMILTSGCGGRCLQGDSFVYRQLDTFDHHEYDDIIGPVVEFHKTHKSGS